MSEPLRATGANSWVDYAENDLKSAIHLLTIPDDCPFNTVCFHAQQCAEKYLKAVLLSFGLTIPKTHDLIVLLNLLPAGTVAVIAGDVSALNRYSVETRYPGDWAPFTREEAEDAICKARAVRDAARRAMSLAS